jgi:cytochrome o ubiquinol oxidase subunit 2
MKWNVILAVLSALIVVALGTFTYLHWGELVLSHPQGPIGGRELDVINLAMLLPLLIVIPVLMLLFFFAIKYHATNKNAHEKHMPNWDHDNWVAETVWWFVPSVIIGILAVVCWQTTYELDPYKPIQSSAKPITIQVVALDWKWLFIYPEQGIAVVNQVEFPENVPVHFEITADAPMNSFWIPSLGGQIMAMPGMKTQLNLMATKRGTYHGASANISGKGFAGMEFNAVAVSQDDFNAWVQQAKQKQNPLTWNSYKALAKPSEYVPVSYYAPVQQNLYTEIMSNVMQPGSMQSGSMQHMHM